MVDVLLRHHPELGPALDGVENAFAPWNDVGAVGVHAMDFFGIRVALEPR